MDEQPGKGLNVRWDGDQWVSGDGHLAWDGTRWAPIRSRLPAAVVCAGAGVLTLLMALFAFALGGSTGPSTMDLAVLGSWVGIAVALVAAGFGFAFGKRWSYWVATIGVLLPSAIYPWSLLQESLNLPPTSSMAIGIGSAAPRAAVAYYSIFWVSLAVALIAVLFRRSRVRWLAVPATIFMVISCFELPAAAALLTVLAGQRTHNYRRIYGLSVFKGLLKAILDPLGDSNL